MKDYLLITVRLILEVSMFSCTLHQLLCPKFSLFKTLLITIPIFVTSYFLIVHFTNPTVQMPLFVLLLATLFYFLFTDPLSKKLLCFFMIYLGFACLDFLIVSIELMAGLTMKEVGTKETQPWLLLLVFYSALCVYAICLVWFFNKRIADIKIQYQCAFLLVPPCEIMMMFGLFVATYLTESRAVYVLAFLGAVTMPLSILALFHALRQVSDGAKAEERSYYLEEQNKIQLQHYQTLSQQIESSKKMHHDIGNYLTTMQILLQKGKLEEAQNCFTEIDAAFENSRIPMYCENQTVNAIFFSKSSYAATKAICMTSKLSIDNQIPIDYIDLIALFSNMLDNAIESCERITEEERSIRISDAMLGNTYTIKMQNSKPKIQTDFQKQNRFFSNSKQKSTKQDPQNHGYGTAILSDIVQKYHGTLRFQDLDSEFVTIVMLQLNEKMPDPRMNAISLHTLL